MVNALVQLIKVRTVQIVMGNSSNSYIHGTCASLFIKRQEVTHHNVNLLRK